MVVICRVVRRGREPMTGLPKHCDMRKPKLGLQINTATPFASMGYELSTTPIISIRRCDSPRHSLPPPYAKDPFNDFPTGTFPSPQTPTAKPAHMSPVQKLGVKQAEEITKYGRDFSGEFVIVTPKGEISSALLWHTAAPLSLLPSPRLDELLPRSRLLSVPFHSLTHQPFSPQMFRQRMCQGSFSRLHP